MYEEKIKQIESQIKVLKEYLLMNINREDWHACWDASIDLARLTDMFEFLKKLEEK